jgi:hypothetical protein
MQVYFLRQRGKLRLVSESRERLASDRFAALSVILTQLEYEVS